MIKYEILMIIALLFASIGECARGEAFVTGLRTK